MESQEVMKLGSVSVGQCYSNKSVSWRQLVREKK